MRRIAQDVGGNAAHRRQEHLEIAPGHQFRIHSAGIFEQRLAQRTRFAAKPSRHAGQVPDRIDSDLGDRNIAIFMQDGAVGG